MLDWFTTPWPAEGDDFPLPPGVWPYPPGIEACRRLMAKGVAQTWEQLAGRMGHVRKLSQVGETKADWLTHVVERACRRVVATEVTILLDASVSADELNAMVGCAQALLGVKALEVEPHRAGWTFRVLEA